jgi:hypothetical protein
MNFEFKVRFSDNKLSLALFSVSAFLILIDASIARTYHFTPHSSPYDTYVFFTLFVLFSISLFLIFLYIREKSFKIIHTKITVKIQVTNIRHLLRTFSFNVLCITRSSTNNEYFQIQYPFLNAFFGVKLLPGSFYVGTFVL